MGSVAQSIDTIWVLICTVLVLLMQAGFVCLETGLVRAKNSINVAIKNVLDFCIAGMGFWLVGFGLMFGASVSGFFGASDFAFQGAAGVAGAGGGAAWIMVFFFFQLAFCSTSTTTRVGGGRGAHELSRLCHHGGDPFHDDLSRLRPLGLGRRVRW